MMLRVGLTGGIGSGKSTVARMFAARQVPVIDTDEIAHELVQPGAPALADITRRFGSTVLDPSGALDRVKLRARVFSDAAERKNLEAILHPRIQEEANRRLALLNSPYAIVVVPLLIETEFDPVDRILVVDVDENLQLKRTHARGGMSDTEIRAVMAAQATRRQRLAEADDVVENNAGLAELEQRVAQLHERYLELARI